MKANLVEEVEGHPLPAGWAVVTLPEVAQLNPPNPDEPPVAETEVSFVPMAAVEAGSGRMFPTERRPWSAVSSGYKRFQEGDVVFARITPCMENGKAALAAGLVNGLGAGSTEFHVLRAAGDLDRRFLLYFMLQETVRRDARGTMTGTAGQLRVPENFLTALRLPVAPPREQHRIVEAIESYFTRLDEAVAGLERVQRNLERYRASVLQAAVEGRLVPTEAELARAEGRDYEPASVLLKRILAERRRRWEEAELSKLKASGKSPKDDRWKAKYEEPAAADTSSLPCLPEGWCWATASQISDFITKGTTPATEFLTMGTGEIPYIKVYNLTFSGQLDFAVDPTFIPTRIHVGQLARSIVRPGDVLMNIVGPPLGKVSIVPGLYPEWNINQAVARFRPVPGVLAEFLALVLRSESSTKWAKQRAKATAGQFNLTLEICRDLPAPLAPAAEQERIIAASALCESACDEACATVNVNRIRSARLRQSILKWAFEGKLVDQDPNEEPAEALLARIRAEREAESEPKSTGRRGSRKGKSWA